VSDPILPLLVMIVVALLALGVVARFLAFGSRQAVGLAGAGLCGLGFMLTFLALIVGQDPGSMALPLGLPGMPLLLAFDPLAAFFLLPIFLMGTASMAFAAEIADAAFVAFLPQCLERGGNAPAAFRRVGAQTVGEFGGFFHRPTPPQPRALLRPRRGQVWIGSFSRSGPPTRG
jgi:hypothetical protein